MKRCLIKRHPKLPTKKKHPLNLSWAIHVGMWIQIRSRWGISKLLTLDIQWYLVRGFLRQLSSKSRSKQSIKKEHVNMWTPTVYILRFYLWHHHLSAIAFILLWLFSSLIFPIYSLWYLICYLTLFPLYQYIVFPLHPGILTWNLQITHLARNMIFQTYMIIIMFHVNLQGCIVVGLIFIFSSGSPQGRCSSNVSFQPRPPISRAAAVKRPSLKLTASWGPWKKTETQ